MCSTIPTTSRIMPSAASAQPTSPNGTPPISRPKGLVVGGGSPPFWIASLIPFDEAKVGSSEDSKAHHEHQEASPGEPPCLRLDRGDLAEEVLALLVDVLDMGDVLVAIDVVDDPRALLVDLMHHSSLAGGAGKALVSSATVAPDSNRALTEAKVSTSPARSSRAASRDRPVDERTAGGPEVFYVDRVPAPLKRGVGPADVRVIEPHIAGRFTSHDQIVPIKRDSRPRSESDDSTIR